MIHTKQSIYIYIHTKPVRDFQENKIKGRPKICQVDSYGPRAWKMTHLDSLISQGKRESLQGEKGKEKGPRHGFWPGCL
jgi:hypothetical protein